MKRHGFRLEPGKILSVGRDVAIRIEAVGHDRWERRGWVYVTVVADDRKLVCRGLSGSLLRLVRAGAKAIKQRRAKA